MRDITGKAAFVTGGASGIGLALGRAFAEAGMNVMLADIEADALSAAVKSLHNIGPDVRGVTCDVPGVAAAAAANPNVQPVTTPSSRRSRKQVAAPASQAALPQAAEPVWPEPVPPPPATPPSPLTQTPA